LLSQLIITFNGTRWRGIAVVNDTLNPYMRMFYGIMLKNV